MTKINPVSPITILRHMKSMFHYHDHGFGVFILLSVILFLSYLSGLPLQETPTVYIEGEIAQEDVISDKDLMIEDIVATQNRQEKIRITQPLIFDLNRESVNRVRADILDFLHLLNEHHTAMNTDDSMQETSSAMNTVDSMQETSNKTLTEQKTDEIIEKFNETYGTHITANTLSILCDLRVQHYTLENLLPWLNRILNTGVLSDMRVLGNGSDSIIIRNRETNTQSLRTLDSGLLDLRELTLALSNKIRIDDSLSPKAKIALIEVLPKLLLPTLAINQEAYDSRIESLIKALNPVYYSVNRGEVLVRAGDKVNRIAQLKMQSIIDTSNPHFNISYSLGVFFLGTFFTLGLFMTPTGTKGRILRNRDQLFMASTLLFTGICVSLLAHYLASMQNNITTLLLPYAFPVTGIAGLSVLIFSARRYCVFGLLIAFFCTILFHGDLELFLFYFFISMISTFIILRTQSRQHVVLGTIPLIFFLLLVGISSTLLYGLEARYYPILILFLLLNALFSMLILFSLSPILEMIFGYTTRFKLMELLSLDHPLLQELMMKVPGTYHHALVVSNLVETAAKTINANSLLVKVGALYHDIGKLSRPDYFSENQFNGINPHDNLAPAMSSLILFAHVKNGTELAETYNLGAEIIDMIQQHHGTRVPRYFYQKAVDLGEQPKQKDYQYPGPRPQSKEAAILMMADTVEAAIRSMGTPSPARIQSSIESLIKNIYAEGQLDDTDLTFKDLNKLIESFTRSITALYHQRVAYSENKKQDINSEKTSTNNVQEKNIDINKQPSQDTQKEIKENNIQENQISNISENK